MDAPQLALVAAAAAGAGAVNAIAGGGSLVTFPVLVACGMPALAANVTNTVALCPGYLGATIAQRRELAGQGVRAAIVLPVAAAGGVAGAGLLIATGEAAFERVIPALLVFAAVLLALQARLRTWLAGRAHGTHRELIAAAPVGLAAVYGGYFGAGMSVIVLAALAVVLDDSLVRINALKQAVSLAVNVAAAIAFAFVGHVDWVVAGVMAGAALVGGVVGGAVASRVPANVLRWLVVAVALAMAVYYCF
ncbi:MAG TPA: sulfite exporter TauE/SafE family protein [Kofleriaceae bacterium]|nr:sulfite exporter TauE/SafE family protein [Kofleriaceae bacterium]